MAFNQLKKSGSILLLSGLVAIAGCGKDESKAAAQQAAQRFERAQGYFEQHQYRSAIIEATNALQAVPNNEQYALLLARMFNELGQYKQTIQLLSPFEQSTNPSLVAALTEAYLGQRKYQTALDYLQQSSARVGTGNTELQLLRARALASSGNFDAAQTLLQSLQQETAFQQRALLELARIAVAQGDIVKAAALCNEILAKNPDNLEALLLAARLAEQSGDLNKAEDHLSHALMRLPTADVLTPIKIATLETMVSVLTKLGHSNEALVYSKALADADPNRAGLQEKFKRGVELFRDGKLDEAEALLSEVYKSTQDDTTGILLGMIKYGKNDLQGATEYLSANVDPEIAPENAVLALAASNLRNAQPEKLLELVGPEQRAELKNPQLQALVGVALIQTGKIEEGEALIRKAQAAQPDNVAISTTLARHYVATGQLPQARALLESAQRQEPQNSAVAYLLIDTYLRTNDKDSALKTAQTLAGQKPEKAENYALLGRTALTVQQWQIAATALQKALQLQPDLTTAQLDLARLHLVQKRPQDAEPLFKAVIQADPQNVAAIKGFIAALETQHGRAEAAKTVEQSVLQMNNTPVAHAVLAEYALRNGKLDDTERHLQAAGDQSAYAKYVRQMLTQLRATQASAKDDLATARAALLKNLHTDPQNATLLAQLARVELRAGKRDEANKLVQQISQLQPGSPGLLELQGDIASNDNQWAQAAEHYRQAWQKVPTNSFAIKTYNAQKRNDASSASKFLGEWRNRQPQNAMPYLLEGTALELQGDKAGAIKTYEAGLKLDNNNVLLLNNLALSYLNTGDRRALSHAETAYRLQPQSAAIVDTYGWVLYKSGEKQKAIEILEQAQKLAPDIKEIADHLAQAKAGN